MSNLALQYFIQLVQYYALRLMAISTDSPSNNVTYVTKALCLWRNSQLVKSWEYSPVHILYTFFKNLFVFVEKINIKSLKINVK